MRNFEAVAALIVLAFIGCTSRQQQAAQPQVTPATQPQQKSELKLTSTAFKEGEPIPRGYTCDGANVSPPLEWTGVPKSAKTIAIIADDPDAPSGTWVHWVLYNLSAEGLGLIENTPATETLTGGGVQGKNDFGKIGYGGPCPPSGTHRYFFKFYALDSGLSLQAGATKAEIEQAMQGHIVGQAQLMGTYHR
ncbi:MAG TPA: YbhB/YbcL family Raf kinase inhibitor-like protein [Pyrinomonadaceae bacterium]|nr:YbhB/YbcL family Raf kinase inhibitor-like protein [Pyrinomonadaceae bacterium]